MISDYYVPHSNCVMNRKMREWAYARWCEGYTQLQIAEALHVSHKTINRALSGKPRIRPILIYKEGDGI